MDAAFKNKLKKFIGVVLIVLGLILHLIPLFPAGWIIIVGLELLGVRLLLQNKIKRWLEKFEIYHKLKDIKLRKLWPLCFLALLSIKGFVGLFEGDSSQWIWLVWISWLAWLIPVKNNNKENHL
jgi:hypothetical protein